MRQPDDVIAWKELIQSAEDAKVVEFLHFSFLMEYEGPVPTPVRETAHLLINHARDVDPYMATKVTEGAMLGLCHRLLPSLPPFIPWCQINALLIHLTKDSNLRRVTMDLSWLHSLAININGFTPREFYLGELKEMHLPSMLDLMDSIMGAGCYCYLYSFDISQVTRQP